MAPAWDPDIALTMNFEYFESKLTCPRGTDILAGNFDPSFFFFFFFFLGC